MKHIQWPATARRMALALSLGLMGPLASAQLSVSPNQSATDLANALVGPGITVSNATLTCPSPANGTFSGGANDLQISNGILLTSGSASAVSNAAGFFESTNNGAPGDASLSLLSGNPTADACVLQFDFVPQGDSVIFRYQFGSEEYPNYTCTQFNDVFGFFISGPGYAVPTNIALVPGTNIPVAINSVNGGAATGGGNIAICNAMGPGSPFPQYFENNQNGPSPVYDGMTKVLIARAAVIPCSTYHFKLGVADASDGVLSSGVFLEQGSLAVVPPLISGCPADILEYTGPGATACGKTVSWTPPTANNNCLNLTSSSTHNPGDFFPVGTTTVTYTFTNPGGSSSCSFDVTVVDNTAPAISGCPNDQTVYTGAGNTACSQTASWTPPSATDNCTAVTVSSTHNPGATFAVGTTTVTYTFTDNYNNSRSCSFDVTVVDNTPPVAICQDYVLNLSGGMGSITPADINNGSTDNCGIDHMSVSPADFTCANAGDNTVTLTVWDIYGNSSSCTANVTVQYQPVCSLSVTPENNVYTGGVPTNIYLGYGPQSATINTHVTGGSGFTYSWSPAAGLSCTNCANPVFTPTAAGIYTFTVTVTNSNGCSTTCSVTFCVRDIRVAGKGNNNKVYLCHLPPGNPANPQTLSISVNAVPSHLGQHSGDQLGKCGQGCTNALARMSASEPGDGFMVTAVPNPFSTSLKLHIDAAGNNQTADVAIYDLSGRLIERMRQQPTGTDLQIGQNLATGVYMIEVRIGNNVERIKVFKML